MTIPSSKILSIEHLLTVFSRTEVEALVRYGAGFVIDLRDGNEFLAMLEAQDLIRQGSTRKSACKRAGELWDVKASKVERLLRESQGVTTSNLKA